MVRSFLASGFALLLATSMQAVPLAQENFRDQSPALLAHSTDIGTSVPGFTEHNASDATYRIGGTGTDLWGTADHFRYAWTSVTGDATLSAQIHIDAPVTHPLAKAMLMFRQSLDPGSPYADIAIHADGHVTLQYRLLPGGETRDVVLPEHNPKYLQIRRKGNTFSVSASTSSASSPGKAATIQLPLQDPAFVGIGVCAHNPDTFQVVTFSNVQLTPDR